MSSDANCITPHGESPFLGSHEEEEDEVNAEEQMVERLSGLKRPLAVTACELCKARKVRCDRVEPSCGWCTRNSRSCVYKGRQKPGFRAGHMRELENKVNKLEVILQALGHRVEGLISISNTARLADDQTTHPLQSPRTPGGVGAQQSDGMICYDSRTLELMSVQLTTNPSGSTEASLRDLPSGELLYNLVDLYFKYVNTWCPILDRKAIFDSFFLGSSIPDNTDRIVLYAIVATALRFSQDPSLTEESRKRYHSVATAKVLLRGIIQTPSIESLQALVILAWDFLGTSDGPQSSNIIAMIARTVLLLNLHVESSLSQSSAIRASVPPSRLRDSLLPQPGSWIEEEGRRRLFWMVYIIECYASVATESDSVFCDANIDRSLPCRYDLFSKNQPVETRWFKGPGRSKMIINQPDNLGSFSYHCEIIRTLSRVQAFLRTPVDICSMADVEKWQNTYYELDNELNTWLNNLPQDYSNVSQLCHSDPTSKISNWIILHSAFVTSVVRLHSCAAYPTVRSHIFTPSYNASQRCLTAVESLREIAQDVFKTGMINLLGPHFVFSLYVAVRLLLVHAACTGTDPNCEYFIFILDQMSQYWGVAGQYARLLDRIWKRSRVGWPYSNGTMSSAPKALSMMRRRAYELHISAVQRPSTTIKPLPTKSVTAEDLDYLEVFDFFNYPRLPTGIVSSPSLHGSLLNLDGVASGKDYFVATSFPTDLGLSYGAT
ncbi:fungal-specific transcription factor domain-containing protein [Talaromyces proteolyticus]|uniref:Fungal-specific transcription factor domain-containing protein n=1 Tax=Talaromyces proteolyticus TaxID=1131652 RepID=A0AAD4KNK4_9EURO|nr:fungal-specific transcription factor domain-containing protein [Talaromyces proteolyticus]KAH8695484.1 fungal-specific transcription factor domain-containing protein [Talaromyces proteolyticus]